MIPEFSDARGQQHTFLANMTTTSITPVLQIKWTGHAGGAAPGVHCLAAISWQCKNNGGRARGLSTPQRQKASFTPLSTLCRTASLQQRSSARYLQRPLFYPLDASPSTNQSAPALLFPLCHQNLEDTNKTAHTVSQNVTYAAVRTKAVRPFRLRSRRPAGLARLWRDRYQLDLN